MRPEIILHVGTEKTGTTSIQSLLGSAYDSLLKAGVLFPKSIGEPCHINLTACALGNEPQHPIRSLLGIQNQDDFDDFVIRTKKGFKGEIENTSPNKIIISDEHINAHLFNGEKLIAFKELCEEFGEIKKVIIYFRRQDEFRLSLFSEAVRVGNIASFDLDNLLPVFKVIPYRLNYLAVLDNLSKVFGRDLLLPKVYDRNLFIDGDICKDFLHSANINLNCGSQNILHEKKSFDQRIIKHLALISIFLKNLETDKFQKLREAILNNCMKIFQGPGPELKPEYHARYLEQFAVQDEAIKIKYFYKNIDANLFPEKEYGCKLTYPDCTLTWLKFLVTYIAGEAARRNSTNR